MADLSVVPDLERELDVLYGLPLGEFVSARNDLVKRLRKAGQRESADALAKLAKPTVSAWALNQLARREPAAVQELTAAGAELVEAQRAALAGAGTEAFERASRARRAAVQKLTAAAASVLAEAGHASGSATLERVASSLRAASVDAAGREQLAGGRLGDDLEDAGFELLAGLEITARPKERPTASPDARKEIDLARKALREAREHARELRRLADAARRESDAAHAAAEAAEARAATATAEAERADGALAEAERALEGLVAGREPGARKRRKG